MRRIASEVLVIEGIISKVIGVYDVSKLIIDESFSFDEIDFYIIDYAFKNNCYGNKSLFYLHNLQRQLKKTFKRSFSKSEIEKRLFAVCGKGFTGSYINEPVISIRLFSGVTFYYNCYTDARPDTSIELYFSDLLLEALRSYNANE